MPASVRGHPQADYRISHTKREYDSIGGTPFNGVRAIAKKHNVFISRLRCYGGRNAKRHHGYDTESSALVSDSGSDDSGDGDSDATM